MEKVLIIDGHNLLFRMFYGIPSSIRNSKGREIKGVLGFLGGLNKLMNQFEPDNIVVVFDTETSTQARLKEDSEYKQNRMDYSDLSEDENPFTQLTYIYQALDHLGIIYHEAREYEADDYIASLCEIMENEYEIVIVSTDKDFLQLVTDRIIVYNPTSDLYYTPEKVYEKFLITPEQMIDYKILVGDSSDNIKGVPKIGPKTAVKILNVGTLEEIYNQEKQLDKKLYLKLNEYKDVVQTNRFLITMNRKIEIKLEKERIKCRISYKKAKDILVECGIY
jgi:DNA polymerase-1